MAGDHDERGMGYGAAVFSVVVIALTGYLTFAAIQGEYGLLRLFQVEAQSYELEAELDALSAEREQLANLTSRLSGTSPDLDLLEEQARRVLGLVHPDDIVIH